MGARKQRGFGPKALYIRKVRRLDAAQSGAYAIAPYWLSARETHRLTRNNGSAIAKPLGAHGGPLTRQEHFKSPDAVDARRAASGQQTQRAALNERKARAHNEKHPLR